LGVALFEGQPSWAWRQRRDDLENEVKLSLLKLDKSGNEARGDFALAKAFLDRKAKEFRHCPLSPFKSVLDERSAKDAWTGFAITGHHSAPIDTVSSRPFRYGDTKAGRALPVLAARAGFSLGAELIL
jgi:hypothetical protein